MGSLPFLLGSTLIQDKMLVVHSDFCHVADAEPSQQVLPGTSIYVSTKSGLSGFADAVMEDVRDMGVKVVSLLPGLVNTKLGRAKGPLEKKHEHLAAQPGDMIQPSDILYALRCVVRWLFLIWG